MVGETNRVGVVDSLRNEDETLARNEDLVRHEDCSIREQYLQAIRIAWVPRISP